MLNSIFSIWQKSPRQNQSRLQAHEVYKIFLIKTILFSSLYLNAEFYVFYLTEVSKTKSIQTASWWSLQDLSNKNYSVQFSLSECWILFSIWQRSPGHNHSRQTAKAKQENDDDYFYDWDEDCDHDSEESDVEAEIAEEKDDDEDGLHYDSDTDWWVYVLVN